MVSSTILLIIACGCVVIDADPLVILRQACMKIRHGCTAGFNHFVPPVVMIKGQADFKMPLPSCPSRPTGGIDVQVCDDDKIPNVKIIKNITLAVHRTGSLESYAVVMMKLHCTTAE